MTDTPDTPNVVALADHRQPTVYTITVVHHWTGDVETFIGGVDLTDGRTRKTLADNLQPLLDRLRADENDFKPVPAEEVPA